MQVRFLTGPLMSYLYGDSYGYLRSVSPKGYQCTFIVQDGKGLKLFASREYRDHSRRKQIELHGLGLAPAPGPSFAADFPDATVFGFETEIADTEIDNLFRWMCGYAWLLKRCHDLGVIWTDAKLKNMGFLGDQPVIIDCGF